MKTTVKVITLAILLSFSSVAQNIGINNSGAAPHSSALLDLSSTNKGFLITRADTADISSPAFRLPTKPEYEAEIATWTNATPTGAFDSPLKFTTGGDRNITAGALTNNETTNPGNAFGYYWTSSISGGYQNMLRLSNMSGGQALVGSQTPAYGMSVRCIKD